jgi:hypothetical protein
LNSACRGLIMGYPRSLSDSFTPFLQHFPFVYTHLVWWNVDRVVLTSEPLSNSQQRTTRTFKPAWTGLATWVRLVTKAFTGTVSRRHNFREILNIEQYRPCYGKSVAIVVPQRGTVPAFVSTATPSELPIRRSPD